MIEVKITFTSGEYETPLTISASAPIDILALVASSSKEMGDMYLQQFFSMASRNAIEQVLRPIERVE